MTRRIEAGQPALSGIFTKAEVAYTWPRLDGTFGSNREPVALFTGETVPASLSQLSDATIEDMLKELSSELGAALGHKRICGIRGSHLYAGSRVSLNAEVIITS